MTQTQHSGDEEAPGSTTPLMFTYTELLPNPDVRLKLSKPSKRSRRAKKAGRQAAEDEEAEKLALAIQGNETLPGHAAPLDFDTSGLELVPRDRSAHKCDMSIVRHAVALCKEVYPQWASIKHPRPVFGHPTLGLTAEDRRLANKKLFPMLIHMEYLEAVDTMRQLWLEPEREYQHLVMDLLKHTTVTILRSSAQDHLFNLLKLCVGTKPQRDTVDELATKHLTTLAYLEPAETWPHMDVWVSDPDPWVKRAAILHQHGLGDFTDRVRLFKYCQQHLNPSPQEAPILEDAIHEALRRCALTYHVMDKPSGAEFVLGFIKINLAKTSQTLGNLLQSLKNTLEQDLKRGMQNV
ncbi:hypothetical protein ACOMHN_057666 [Nucella lapillus]